jgi:hypothetical protein
VFKPAEGVEEEGPEQLRQAAESAAARTADRVASSGRRLDRTLARLALSRAAIERQDARR